MQKKNKFGPAPLPSTQLKLTSVKVGFDQAQLAELDSNRGHYPRAAHLRAAGLKEKLKPLPAPGFVSTWSESARVQSCFHHINDHAEHLNSLRLASGEDAAARALQAATAEIYKDFKEFRAEIFGDWIPSRLRDAG